MYRHTVKSKPQNITIFVVCCIDYNTHYSIIINPHAGCVEFLDLRLDVALTAPARGHLRGYFSAPRSSARFARPYGLPSICGAQKPPTGPARNSFRFASLIVSQ